MKKYGVVAILVILLLGLSLLWLHMKRSPIILGFMGPLTGKYADLGVQGRNGAFLAVEDINAEGGISGRPVVLKTEDDRGTPEGAKEAAMKLKAAGAFAIVGPMLSTSAYAIKDFIDENRLVTVSPTVSSSRFSGKKDYFFRVIIDTGVRSKGLARFALDILDPPTKHPRLWCMIYDLDNVDYTQDFINNFSHVVEEPGDLTSCMIAFRSKEGPVPDYVFGQLEAVNPDAVVLAVSAIDGSQILNWMKTNLPHVPVFGSVWMMTEELRRRLTSIEPLEVFAEHIEPPRYTEEATRFKERFRKRFGKEANFPALFSYFAVQVLTKALKKADGNVESLREILSSGITYYSFLVGRITIDEFGDASHLWWIYKLENGGLKLVHEEAY